MKACFLVLKCEKRTGADGEVRNLKGEAFTLGRGEECDVTADSDLVSRVHARRRFDAGAWLVEDGESTNGTFLNGKRVATAEVRVGDALMLGEGGPLYLVIAADGPGAHGVPEETRSLRVAGRRPRRAEVEAPKPSGRKKAPKPPKPKKAKKPMKAKKPREPAAETAPAAAAAPKGGAGARRLLVVLPLGGMVAGAAFGALEIPDGIPGKEIAAPALWAARLVGDAFPAWAAPRMGRLLCVALALYGSLYGLVLQRPLRRLPFVILLAGIHVFALFTLHKL